FHLSALKMMGYFYSYSVLSILFLTAWRKKWLDASGLTAAVWLCLALAAMQTYVLGNDYGISDADFRFTSFTGAQSFAPFLLAFIVLLWFSENGSFSTKLTVGVASIGLILTGSRSIFLGFAWALFVGVVYLGIRSGHELNFSWLLRRILVALLGLSIIGAIVFNYFPDNRMNQMIRGAFLQRDSLEDVGTFAWRFALYMKAINVLSERSVSQLLIGSGTSSAGSLMLVTGTEDIETVDPNRSLNNEFLRSLYEWGLIGLILLCLLVFELASICVRLVRSNSREGWAFLAMLVPLCISLLVENILADAGSPGGVGYALVATAILAAWNSVSVRQREAAGPSSSHTLRADQLGIEGGT
ncbi:MAG: O-antigen ligase family protein, partial [Candidatus Acidiferrales bacterium]